MVLGYIGSKHTVHDLYPLRNKRVLVLVDPQNILDNGSDFNATYATLSYLLEKKASLLIASSFGPLTGNTLNLTRRERDAALDAFSREGGLGYTNFFSCLSPSNKVSILEQLPGSDFIPLSDVDRHAKAANTGKTSLFASLTNEQKRDALRMAFPNHEFQPCSTLPFVAALQKRLEGVSVTFVPDCMRPPLHQLQPGQIMVLENLRFYRNETSSDADERQAMAEVLASAVDLFVNDSFATAHMVNASNVEVPHLLQHGAAGQSMDRELAFYSKFLSHPARPLAVIISGGDIVNKLRLIRRLVERVDRILIAGAVAFPFLVARGYHCGKGYLTGEAELQISLSDSPYRGSMGEREGSGPSKSCSEYAADILALCDKKGVEVVLPSDHIVVAAPQASGAVVAARALSEVSVPVDLYSVDCGPLTANLFMRWLRGCRTLFWVGAAGWVSRGFDAGTRALASNLANVDIVTILAGRHLVPIIHEMGISERILHVSSGGAASLAVLLGAPLPGVEKLSDVASPVDPKTSVSVYELLRGLPLFMGCNSHQVRLICKKFVRRVHAKGDYVVRRGDRYTRISVVAHGGLVAHYDEEFISTPSRYVGKGQTVGMYDFITQATSMETVRAALPDTVTYQLSTFSLNDLLNCHPDLAAQLLQNISEPLRQMVNADNHLQQTPSQVTWRNSCRTRVPQSGTIPATRSFWGDVIQDAVATILFQRLTMRYTPYVSLTSGVTSAVVPWLHRIQSHRYLSCSLAVAFLRNLIYHNIIQLRMNPVLAAITSSIAISPLRIWSYGILYCDMNFKLVLQEAVSSAMVSCAPSAAYQCALELQQRYERWQQRRLRSPAQMALMVVVKLLLGIVIFPIIYQRNFVYTQPSASRFWNGNAFRAYELKQFFSVLLRCVVHASIKSLGTA